MLGQYLRKGIAMKQKNNALVINPIDSVAVVLQPLRAGDTAVGIVAGEEKQVRALQDIPIYHKIAIRTIQKNGEVFKYGKNIGRAICDITPGEHVHSHNIVSNREEIAEEGR